MNTQEVLDPKSWAERTFGGVQLHDMRRTRRTVQTATRMAENPLGSLPAQMQTWRETKALYRLLDEPDVSFAALMQPHLQQSRDQANASPVVLLVQDTTDIDLSHRRHPSAPWDKSATNEDGGFSCKRCWRCVPRHERSSGAWLRNPLCAFLLPRENSGINGASERSAKAMSG